MEDAIDKMNGIDLDGSRIIVEKCQPNSGGSGRDREGDCSHNREGGRDHDYGGGRGGRDCFKCGKPRHFAKECPGEGGKDGGRYGGRDDRYGGGGEDSRYGPERNEDRYSDDGGAHSRDSDVCTGGDRYGCDPSASPYDRMSSGRFH